MLGNLPLAFLVAAQIRDNPETFRCVLTTSTGGLTLCTCGLYT